MLEARSVENDNPVLHLEARTGSPDLLLKEHLSCLPPSSLYPPSCPTVTEYLLKALTFPLFASAVLLVLFAAFLLPLLWLLKCYFGEKEKSQHDQNFRKSHFRSF